MRSPGPPASGPGLPAARLEAVVTTASMNEAAKSAWCRGHGAFPAELDQWRASCTAALAEPEEARASPQATRQDRKRIKELERELLRKDARPGRDSGAAGAVKKSTGDLQQGRGRMIGLEDRQSLARDIDVAHSAGARLHLACEIAGIDLRTLQRWKAHDGLVAGDGRPQAVRPLPSHALSAAERAELLRVANEPRFAAVPPARIVPMLADEGVYLASESSFSRVLRAQGQSAHRGRAKAPRAVRAAHHAHRHGTACGVVLGHDLPARERDRPVVPPVPDPGPVQPQDRGLGGP